MPTDFDLLTIGHSNLPVERFIDLVRKAGVATIADVRSVPFSRRFPWLSARALAPWLQQAGMAYLPFGEALGGRPRDAGLYRDGIADYEKMAATPQFSAGLDQVCQSTHGLCLMCAEREPLDCHRCLLVGRALAERGMVIGHILIDGRVEPHTVTETRLLEDAAGAPDLFSDRAERLAAAYRRRAGKVAARLKA